MINKTQILLAVLIVTLHKPALSNDEWVDAFYTQADPIERQAIVDSLDLSRYSFDDLYRLLSSPPAKSRDVPTGLIKTYRIGDKKEKFHYGLRIPDNYDSNKQYPLVIYLHGTVARKKPKLSQVGWRSREELVNDEYIQVFPTAWDEAKWWTNTQKDNIHDIIDRVKATYHIDTNKVFLTGLSDGGTACYYMAATSPSQFAGMAPVIGYPGVLNSKRERTSENTYPINMRAVKMIAFNTHNDSLYSPEEVQFYIDSFKEIGVDIEWVAYPDGGHDAKAFFRSMPRIKEFISSTSRDSYPDKIIWQYEKSSGLHRVTWLTIHELMSAGKRQKAQQLLPSIRPSDKQSGLIELIKLDNKIIIQNYGVKSYSLLLSPDHFDFDQAITIIENDKVIHNARVKPSKKTLLDYAARDFDPRRLYAAEVKITGS